MDSQNMAALVNVSMFLLILSALPFLAFVGYVVLNSPLATPLVRWRAENAFRKQNYALAAKLYTQLQHWQEHLEGHVYARKAAQSLEMAGSLREALEHYRLAEDWPKVGQLLQETGQMAEAKAVYLEHQLFARLVLCYEQENAFLQAGLLYEQELDKRHKAEQSYKKALNDKDPEVRLSAQLHLVRLYLATERAEEARSLFAEVDQEMNSSAQFQEFPELQALRARVGTLL